MDIPFTQRLSFKQAAWTVVVAFILGMLLSVIRIGFDYASENATIDREMQALLKTSYNPAARIAYNIDAELAQELVRGLLRSPAVIRAEITDNNNGLLAIATRQAGESRFRFISDQLFGPRRLFREQLSMPRIPHSEFLGELRLEVDTYLFGSHFLNRALLTLASGFIRSLLLSLILLVLFYVMLTKPLVRLIAAMNDRDPRSPGSQPLPCPPGHEDDEIGLLVQVTNQQLARINGEIRQRREAENRLTRHLGQLESIVSSRTAALESANAQLLETNRSLEQARATALEMAHARSAFLANMSHEIRTPLNGVLGMLALSLDSPLSVEQRRQLGIAHTAGNALMALLNNILDLSKFEAGKLEVERIPFDLGALVEEVAALQSQSAAAGVALTCIVAPTLPALVIGDPVRIRQIVGNLLSNALKFTHQGSVEISVEPLISGVRICIRDSGIGIPQPVQALIFQPFTQGNASITRQFGGTGLGLALARKLCEAMQGRLELVSSMQHGSEFSVTLPLASHSPAIRQAELRGRVAVHAGTGSGLATLFDLWLPVWGLAHRREAAADTLGDCELVITDRPDQVDAIRHHFQGPLILVAAYNDFLPPEQAEKLQPLLQLARPPSRKSLYLALQSLLNKEHQPNESNPPQQLAQHQARVLLVEDNPVNQLVAKGMLARLGCDVVTANHGGEALQALENQSFDLILMDCNMPVLDGYATSRKIRQSGRWPRLPIIALTANALPEERERCRAAGMNDYLAKPFHRAELNALLETWLPTGAAPA